MKDIRTDRGTAAQSGASDLALMGVVPGAFVVSSPAQALDVKLAQPASAPDAAGEASSAPAQAIVAAALASPATTAAVAAGLQSPTLASPSAASVQGRSGGDTPYGAEGGRDMLHGHVAFDGGQEGQELPAIGAAIPEVPVAPAAAADAALAPALTPAAVPPDLATLETIRASVATLQEAIGALGQRIEGGAEPATAVIADAGATVAALDASLADIAASAHGVVAEVATTADQAISGVTAQVGAIAAGVTSGATETISSIGADVSRLSDDAVATIGNVADLATASLGTATDLATDTVVNVVASSTGSLEPVVAIPPPAGEAVAEITEGLAGAAESAVGNVTGLLADDPGGLAGGDPAAGITTLVGMVTASDAFHLKDNGDAPIVEPALGALGAADLLAEAHPAESLLGIADNDHGGLLGGHHDDDHGLLGLG